MREIKTEQRGIPQVYRFSGHLIYLKSSDGHQGGEMIQRLKNMGASIAISSNGWIRVDLFHKHKEFNLGNHTFSLVEDSLEDIEEHLFEFYKTTLEAQGMKCEVSQ